MTAYTALKLIRAQSKSKRPVVRKLDVKKKRKNLIDQLKESLV